MDCIPAKVHGKGSTFFVQAVRNAFCEGRERVYAAGKGIPRIIKKCEEYGLSTPLFEEFGDGVKVTLYRKVSNAFDKYMSLLDEAEITATFVSNIAQVFAKCGTSMVFGQVNVMDWLNCSKSKATNIMNAMKAAKVIEKVTGLGAGKYKFIEL